MPIHRPCLLALVLCWAACTPSPMPGPAPSPAAPAPPVPPPTDATDRTPPPPTAGAVGGSAADPAPAPADPAATAAEPGQPPATQLVREAAVLRPMGDPGVLAAEGETVVEPDAQFRVELRDASEDARLLLFDAADAVVPSSASHEIGEHTRLTLRPTEPLVPGSRYHLRIDGAVGRELHVGDRAYAPAAYTLKVAGEPPPPPPPKAKKKAKRARY